MTPLPILFAALGGTISMSSAAGGGLRPALSAGDLLASAGRAGLTIDLLPTEPKPGASLTFAELVSLAHALLARLPREAAGAVVVQGTDTLEETAFLLDLWLDGDAPVVLTGAMRGADAPGADGPANLEAAFAVASDPTSRGLGAVVVLDDTVHSAGAVTKAHTVRPSAFVSPGGAIGEVVEGALRLRARPLRPWAQLRLPVASREAPVALITAALGDDGRLLEAVEGAGYEGVVVQAMGAGHVPQRWVEPLASLAASMPVVLASRVGAGRVLERTYGFPGSESDLLSRGLTSAGGLPPLKARLLLQALLGAGRPRAEIASAFALC